MSLKEKGRDENGFAHYELTPPEHIQDTKPDLPWMVRVSFDVGWLSNIILARDPRPAKEQINDRYARGGGWFPSNGFKMSEDKHFLLSKEDPPVPLIAYTKLRDEWVGLYLGAWLAIVQADGSYEIARVD